MPGKNTATLQALLRFALPLGTSLVAGSEEIEVNWAVTVRAQPPAFPEIYGGELALLALDLLRSFESRITLADVVGSLADVGVQAIAVTGDIDQAAVDVATATGVGLLAMPATGSMTTIERAVNTLIVNQAAQLTQRAVEVQRQLTRLAAENRDLSSLLQVVARATARPVLLHDDVGMVVAQVSARLSQRNPGERDSLQSLPHSAFRNWLKHSAPTAAGVIVSSPIGHTTVLTVEKRVAGYLSMIDSRDRLDDFDRLVLAYGADVCAIELAKIRAIASAVEQVRGDWVQMWLNGTLDDGQAMNGRARQAGFDLNQNYIVTVFHPETDSGVPLPLDSLLVVVRDDLVRRQIDGAVGQYADAVVALYPLEHPTQLSRMRQVIQEVRQQLATRVPAGQVAAGVSRPANGLSALREAYREARDALSIAGELGEHSQTTHYGDLKLYQLLLSLKRHNLEHLRQFHHETIRSLVEHDDRRQGDLLRTLDSFFRANGNLAKAAQDLDVHRNTLVYRLDRIGELTGLDLNDADNRLILHLALKIHRLLATLPGE